MTVAGVRWPGWTKQRTLLLPVSPKQWPPPVDPLPVQGIVLRPKRELHITVVGTALGRTLEQARRAGAIGRHAVRDAFLALDWTWSRTGERTLLQAPPKRPGGSPRHALVEHVALPAMAEFHGALGRMLGHPLPVPPPHVTLYVAGSDRGIGLPDPETLASYRADWPFTPSDGCWPLP